MTLYEHAKGLASVRSRVTCRVVYRYFRDLGGVSIRETIRYAHLLADTSHVTDRISVLGYIESNIIDDIMVAPAGSG